MVRTPSKTLSTCPHQGICCWDTWMQAASFPALERSSQAVLQAPGLSPCHREVLSAEALGFGPTRATALYGAMDPVNPYFKPWADSWGLTSALSITMETWLAVTGPGPQAPDPLSWLDLSPALPHTGGWGCPQPSPASLSCYLGGKQWDGPSPASPQGAATLPAIHWWGTVVTWKKPTMDSTTGF